MYSFDFIGIYIAFFIEPFILYTLKEFSSSEKTKSIFFYYF